MVKLKFGQEGACSDHKSYSGSKTIYGVCWNPENDTLLYCSEKNLTIIPTLPGIKQNLVESS